MSARVTSLPIKITFFPCLIGIKKVSVLNKFLGFSVELENVSVYLAICISSLISYLFFVHFAVKVLAYWFEIPYF